MQQLNQTVRRDIAEAALTKLKALIDTENLGGAIAFNAEFALATPLPTGMVDWIIGQFRDQWGEGEATIAREAWMQRGRLASLSERLERVKPKPKPAPETVGPNPRPQPDAASSVSRTPFRDRLLKSRPQAQPQQATSAEQVKFHESDLAPDVEPPPTIEERDAALTRLAELYVTDPLVYVEERNTWAQRLCTTREALDKAVKIVRDRDKDDKEQSQATKLVAIGVGKGVKLWHSPDGTGYVSVRVADHLENYRLQSIAFDEWLRAEYGRQYTCKIGGQWLPQVPGSQAVRDAIAQLGGTARHREQFEPAIRVGGNREEIWIDLGTDDWRVIRVTAEGWEPRKVGGIPFIRSGSMLPLPEPIRSGSIRWLHRVVNVRASEFVLVAGWLLQALCPEGPYAHFNVHGESGEGKTQLCRTMRRTVDPSRYDLRKASKVEDLFIAARNNWVLCFDNMSWISKDWSDTLCMLATGMSFGTRKHYTNDEEVAFAAKRTVIFNGIPAELTERSDLASRIIKIEIPPIVKRKTEAELEAEFLEVWPGVFGALLNGLSGAIRDWQSIFVDDAARMMDFERWAEAGCRAMGFREDEFVDAYAANRAGSMAISAEANPVGRAVIAFLKGKPKGFAGQMQTLYLNLNGHKGNAGRSWPCDETRLSSELKRLLKPLKYVGITCKLKVDRRKLKGGTQKDVVIGYTETIFDHHPEAADPHQE